MTIVSIRGTHGSGKSTIVARILKRYNAEIIEGPSDWRGRPTLLGYRMFLPNNNILSVVGPYRTACGGCDAVQPYARILPLIKGFAEFGHVLFEGALVSSSYGSIGEALNEMLEEDPIFAFLDTPLPLCLERIALRRAARGKTEPVNPHNTTVKFDNVQRTKDQMRKLGSSIRIVDIDHTQPVRQVMGLFGVKLTKEPS